MRFVALDHIRKASECADEGDGEPVARRFNLADLRADVLSEMRQGVALAETALRSDVFIAACKRNRLEADERDFLGIFHRELDDGADLVVVHIVDDGNDENDFDARFVHVLNSAELHVKEVADLAVAVGVVADAVELQVGVAHTGFEGFFAEFLALGELDAIGGGLDTVVADLAGVGDGVKEERAHGGLTAGELHGHLAARLDLERVVQDFLHFFPAEFVDVADLVGVHEARIAHHVATVGEIDGENGAAAVADGRRAVLVEVFVVVRGNVAAGELLFDPVEELGIDGHHVFIVAMDGAILDHPNLIVALDDLRLDFADFFVHQIAPVFLAGNDRFTRLFDACRAERIGLPREAKRGLGLFPGL